MSDAIPLPSRPNLEQYKKLAKDLQRACKSGADGVYAWAAQLAEHLMTLDGRETNPEVRRQIEREARRISRRWQEFQATNSRATRCTLSGAQFFLAREHGFASWPKFAQHLEALARTQSSASTFEAAADAIVQGDAAALRRLLRDHPDLARTRSNRDHRSTLLHYVSANGIEDYRQKTPKNIVEITNVLLDAACDVNAESDAYGGGCTTLGLVATSVHPEQAGVQIELLQTLLSRGARMDQPSAGGNRHSAVHGCIANGQPRAAAFLASHGAVLDLESAAGLGRLDVVEALLKDASVRPQMESAFLFACAYGRSKVVEFLLAQGVDPGVSGRDGRNGLHMAGYCAHTEVIKVLLEKGTPVDARDRDYHATPLDVALWTWEHTSDRAERERCYDVVARMVQAGAKFDPEQWRDPQSSKGGMLERIAADPRMQATLAGERGL